MKIYKLEPLDQHGVLTQVQAPPGFQQPKPEPEYFADAKALEAKLRSLSIDPSRGLDNGQFVSHKSHLGTFVVHTLEAQESPKVEATPTPEQLAKAIPAGKHEVAGE